MIGLGFLQPREKGGSTWRYLYQALGQFSLKKRHEFFSLRFYVFFCFFFVFWFQARFLGVSLNYFFFLGFLVLNFFWFGVFFRDSSEHT